MLNAFVPTPGVIGVKDAVIEAFSEGEAEAVTLGDCYVLGSAAALRDQFLNKAARPNLSLY